MRSPYAFGALLAVIIIGGIWFFGQMNKAPAATVVAVSTSTPVAEATSTYGMAQYSDAAYGFSFWYPSALGVTATATNESIVFPGGTAVEEIHIGAEGGTEIFVVNSPNGTITDEPANHASPIGQTKYFYDSSSSRWMTSFPDAAGAASARATTTADVSKTTMGGFIILASGRRFNTSIIPLDTTRFLVITDGGGSSFTNALAKTVARSGAIVDPIVQSNTLQAEAGAFAQH